MHGCNLMLRKCISRPATVFPGLIISSNHHPEPLGVPPPRLFSRANSGLRDTRFEVCHGEKGAEEGAGWERGGGGGITEGAITGV